VNAAASQRQAKSLVERIADAILYEGYILYPYRASAVKNQQRWNFGAVCPDSYARTQRTERSEMTTECLLEAESQSNVSVKLRFLHLLLREVAEHASNCQLAINECGHVTDESGKHFQLVPSLEVGGQFLQTWQEAVEREVAISNADLCELTERKVVPFEFPENTSTEEVREDIAGTPGLIVRTQQAVAGEVELSASNVSPDKADRQLIKLRVRIRNVTPFDDAVQKTRDEALLRSLVSTHTILEAQHGSFVSLLDPPENYKSAATACNNEGTYPVLVGEEGTRDCMLSSPIILYDYPQIAPESAGDLFDATEIDEILTLRIMSLTDAEKREMRSIDHMARQLLERTESLSPSQLMDLHGVMKKA
jgi:hypothetical protein